MAIISMKSSTPSISKATLVILVIALVVQFKGSVAQNTCPTQLGNLNVCAPYVVPGTANTIPSSDCCGALQAVEHECLCNTLRVASRLPSSCNLPPLNCGN
ncbi:hypothetical protein BVRB_3g066380 [Beta vulgaris subsp. vulgaris]|nr:hypothetical protein BVRB_3g066380 [Beta vulgaris subsp. vulgaris]